MMSPDRHCKSFDLKARRISSVQRAHSPPQKDLNFQWPLLAPPKNHKLILQRKLTIEKSNGKLSNEKPTRVELPN